MSTTVPQRLAAGILVLEGLALLLVGGWEVVALVGGDTDAAVSSIALIVLTVVGAAAVMAFGVAVSRGQSWGRSGGIVTQLLMLAVAIGAVTGPAPSVGFALLLAVPAVAGLVVLFTAVRRAAARRMAEAPGE
jgi:hypothetical protein